MTRQATAAELEELSNRIFTGELRADAGAPGLAPRGRSFPIDDRTLYFCAFGNVIAVRTDSGLVLVDSGGRQAAQLMHQHVRAWDDRPVHTVIFTHGHLDHTMGVGPFDDEADAAGHDRPRVVGHENMPPRFDRYALTAGYNETINLRQFAGRVQGRPVAGASGFWPTTFRYPDLTYRDELTLDIGGIAFELHHGKGETDDHTYVWLPDRKVLCCGDFFIWCCPNAGNPQKAQRYPLEWAKALREMAGLGAEVMLPGHVVPIWGSDRIRTALTGAADILDSLVFQTLEHMNAGATLDETLQSVKLPQSLLAKPYLRPVYDEPEFVIRNVWRLYGGWYDGDPSSLKPAPRAAVAAELAALAGGAGALARRAQELAGGGDLRLAGHLAEFARLVAVDDADVASAYKAVNKARAAAEMSLMARAIFSDAASRA